MQISAVKYHSKSNSCNRQAFCHSAPLIREASVLNNTRVADLEARECKQHHEWKVQLCYKSVCNAWVQKLNGHIKIVFSYDKKEIISEGIELPVSK